MSKITWLPRYSKTMDDDKFGRWAIVGYVGNPAEHGQSLEAVWIKKTGAKFCIDYQFPYNSIIVFNTIDECKEAAETELNHFLKICK